MNRDQAAPHSGRAIRDEVRIQAPPQVVWDAWADPDQVSRWFVDRAEGRMEAGREVRWLWEGGERMVHRVVEARAPERLVLAMDVGESATVIEITLEQDGGHTVVRLVQSGFGEGEKWDAVYDGMASGWMIALAILKHFAERYFGRPRTQLMVLTDASFDAEDVQPLQRTAEGVAGWLARPGGTVGSEPGEPVRLILSDGRTLTGTVLRQTSHETLWSWEEVDGVLELKAFKGPHWGSKVGVRVMSWLDDASGLADLGRTLGDAVSGLAALL